MRIHGCEGELAGPVSFGDLAGQQGRVVLLRGRTGSGKTALVRAAGERWRRAGVLVVELRVPPSPEERGRYGIDPLLREVLHRLDDRRCPGLADAIDTVRRLRRYNRDDEVRALLGIAVRAMFQCLTAVARTALIIDSAHDFGAHLVVEACRSAGALVVVTCGPGAEPFSEADELFFLADEVVDVRSPAPPRPDERGGA